MFNPIADLLIAIASLALCVGVGIGIIAMEIGGRKK